METGQEFKTSDFVLAISILSLGGAFIRIDPKGQGKSDFVFTNTEELETTVGLFWKNQLMIEPRHFYFTHKFLKGKLNQAQGR